MFSSSRALVVAGLTAVLLVLGLLAPAAAEPAPELPATVGARVDGLPAAQRGGRVSRQVATPIPFSMVGFKVPAGATVQFRTSPDGRAWGAWTEAEVEPEEGPDAGSPEGQAAVASLTTPIWVGAASYLQTRVHGARASARPENVDAHLIDSSGLGRSWGRRIADRFAAAWRGTPPAAAAKADRPDIITRSQWGADESWRRSGPSYASKLVMGFVHHTAGSSDYTRAEADDVVRGVYRYHVMSNGWSDIGYNFLVDRFGRIYEGRYGGVSKPVIGAHAGGFNTGTFGVSLMGNYVSQRPSKAMRGGLRRILAWKFDISHIDVLGTTEYTSYGSSRYSYGTRVTMNRLSGHRDASSTSCPGAKTYEMLPGIRRGVADLQGPVVLNPRVSPSTVEVVDGRSVSGAVTFKARLRPAGAWTVTVTDDAGRIVHTNTGSDSELAYRWLPVGVEPGTYSYAIGGPQRRPARGTLQVTQPEIHGSVSPRTVTYAADGLLPAPLTFSGDLYNGADWELQVYDPDGQRVWRRTGTGATMTRQWSGPLSSPGRYAWRLTAPGAAAVGGTFRVYTDRVDRTAAATGSAAAAAAISRRTFAAGTARRAVLASTAAPGYALAGSSLAGRGGPVLYTAADALPAKTLTELRRVLRPTAVVRVLGNASVISEAVVAQLQAELAPRRIERVAGKDTTIVASQAADLVIERTGATTAVVVGTGGAGTWRHSVGAGAYAAAAGLPVLVTRPDTLSRGAANAIARHGITATTIIGNTDAVSATVRSQLPGPRRVAGSSGSATTVAISAKLFARTTAATDDGFLFAGTEAADGWTRALAAAPLAARTGATVLAARRNGLPDVTAEYLTGLDYRRTVLGQGLVLGNTETISSETETTLARLLQ